MMRQISIVVVLCMSLTSCMSAQSGIPEKGFVYVNDVIPSVRYDIRYAGNNNFLGRPVKGYHAAEAVLTQEAATALKAVQLELYTKGLRLKIFDAYRPQRAVNDFIEWANDLSDTIKKREYYPDVPKSELFKRGYIASRSGHSRGSTVDLTIVDMKTGKELDMGSPYDFFGDISHYDTQSITDVQRRNRTLLRTTMEKHGFKPYDVEWWHYTLKDEPYPETYFDFPVKTK
ncbi:MAG TPA: M15 family metallopeptidase [Saprospiraceae bacterium]|nr:M15 family metallopeptidase [Saprospiraceae bacterium]